MKIRRPPIFAMLIAFVFCGGSFLHANRPSAIPARETFSLFPMRIAGWQGQKDQMSPQIVEALKVEDYLLANFSASGEPDWVNLYVAYYDRQLLGSAAHSPRTCIPGDGWEINELSLVSLNVAGVSLVVNRAVISKGENKQLVYYWFDQRGRILASEYAVKWYLFVDGLFRRRTDGALLRLVTPIHGRDAKSAERRLQEFLKDTYPRLRPFLPS